MRHFFGSGVFRSRKLTKCSNRQNELLHCSDRMAPERKTEKTPMSEKDKLAAEAIDHSGDFQEGLASVKRKYPISQFQAFWSATKRYAELTKADALMHKQVAPPFMGCSLPFLGT